MQVRRRLRGQKVQIPRGKEYRPWLFTAVWPHSFFTRHPIAGLDDVPAVEGRGASGGVEDKLTSFLQTSEGLSFPSEADAVKRCCANFSLKDVENGIGEAGTRKASWVDDRNTKDLDAVHSSGNSRRHKNWLTATELLEYFKEPRYNNGNETDAERRLLCIADLTPDFILSLAVTCPFSQGPILRDAICKHVGFQASILTKLSSQGICVFQMEYHLPYFAIRKPPSSDRRHQNAYRRPWRESKDILLMREQSSESAKQEVYRIYQAQVSCVVYGYDEWQWTACAFMDTEHDSGDLYDSEYSHHSINEEANEDPIITGFEANKPIWRPRQYFVKSFEVNIKEVNQEWHQLVYKMEADIIAYKRAHASAYSSRSSNPRERCEEMKSSFHWTWQRTELLSEFIDLCSGTLQQWNAFILTDGGDINYFSDLHDLRGKSTGSRHNQRTVQSLSAIKKEFDTLRVRLQRLEMLKNSLSRDLEVLKLRLSLEGNEAREDASFTSKFLLWVPTPIAIAAAICSMQPSFLPFSPNPLWFCLILSVLLGGMCLLDFIMKKWDSWQRTMHSWIKEGHLRGAACGLQKNDQDMVVPCSYVRGPADDLESLGTRVLLGGNGTRNSR